MNRLQRIVCSILLIVITVSLHGMENKITGRGEEEIKSIILRDAQCRSIERLFVFTEALYEGKVRQCLSGKNDVALYFPNISGIYAKRNKDSVFLTVMSEDLKSDWNMLKEELPFFDPKLEVLSDEIKDFFNGDDIPESKQMLSEKIECYKKRQDLYEKYKASDYLKYVLAIKIAHIQRIENLLQLIKFDAGVSDAGVLDDELLSTSKITLINNRKEALGALLDNETKLFFKKIHSKPVQFGELFPEQYKIQQLSELGFPIEKLVLEK